MLNTFAETVFNNNTHKTIIAKFANGSAAEYTTAVYNLLISDPDTVYVMDAETGELLYFT